MKAKKTKRADLEGKRPVFFSIGLIIALSSVLFAFSWKTPVNKPVEVGHVNWEAPEELVIPSTKEPEKEIAPPMVSVEEILLVDNAEDLGEIEPDIFDYEINEGEGVFVKNLVENRTKDPGEERVLDFVDQMPEFPGGEAALLSFISKTVKYPVVAQENGIQGRVFVRFVVNIDGSISNAMIVRGADEALDREALRVVSKMPRWSPGMQNGHTVRVSYNIPINFVLQ